MDCPNCAKRPVKRFYSFSLNGVKFKDYLNGYFRCRHCGTLLKQTTVSGLGSIPSYEKGFWKRFFLSLVLMFGVIMSMFILFGESEAIFWISFPIFAIIFGWVMWIGEIKVRYWILKEVNDVEEDQKKQRRMGTLGWILLLGFCLLMLGGGIIVDLYIDLSGISEWQYLTGMVLYMIVIVMGSLGIFNYFSEEGAKNYR